MTITFLEQKLDSFAVRSFRDTADRDYVHARLAYRSQLVQQFFWSSLHCLEKYMKCILLLNRVVCKNVSHAVTPLLDLMQKQGPFSVDISAHTLEFIKRLEGVAEYRYFQVSYFNYGINIGDLDLAIWEVRRYCQILDHSRTPGAADSPPLKLELERLANAHMNQEKGTCIIGGWIEGVIKNSKHPAREALIWKNLYFGSSHRKKIRISSYQESGIAPLFAYPEIIDELNKYIRIEKSVADMWRKEAAQRLDLSA
jgi:hypothetical protein